MGIRWMVELKLNRKKGKIGFQRATPDPSSRSATDLSVFRGGSLILSWNSTGKIGRIGRHRAEKPDVEVMMCLGPMPPDASDFPGGIPAIR